MTAVTGTNGNDNITVTAAAGSNTAVSTGNGNDVVTVSGVGNTDINTGNGNDLLNLTGSSGTNTVNAGNGSDIVLGGSGSDVVTGGNGTDVLSGGAGADILVGGNGADTLYGGAGNDILIGGNGKDVLIGGSGSDLIDGSKGADLGIYALSDHYKTVGGTLQSIANDVDYYYGGKGDDTFRIVVTADQYALISSQLSAYASWLASHKNSDDTYSFNFANGTSGAGGLASTSNGGLVVGSWAALQIEIVNTGNVTLAQNATSATGSINSLGLFTNKVGGSSANFDDTFKIAGLAAGSATAATSLDPTVTDAKYVDGTGTLATSYTVTGVDGTLTVSSDGAYNYVVTSHTASTDTFTLKTIDQNGFITNVTLTFSVPTANHAAVIGDPTIHDVTEDVAVSGSGNLTAAGSISITDADQGQASFQTSVTGVAGNLGNLVLAANGSYTYTVADSAVQYLGASDSKVDTFTVTSLDGTQKQVSFTIHGVNDAAVIGTPTVHDVTEDVAVNGSGNLTAAGSISITDADQGQASFQTTVSSASGNLGSLVLAANGSYTYTVADSAVQYLGASDSKVDTFTVTSLDGTQKQISFTIHGANDAAVIGTPTVADVTEDVAVSGSGNLTAAGSISITDADQGQASFQTSVTGVAGNLGNLVLAANGSYTYTVADSAVQYLGASDSKVETFTVTSLDGTQKQVSFTIHGANDAAVIGTPTVADVAEDVAVSGSGNLTAAGSISITDADQGQASFQTSVTGVAGNLGNLVLAANGSYTYTVADGAVQYLGASDSKVETFTVTSLDGTQKQVSFTIHGANDAAVIGTPTVHDVTEDVAVNGSGNLTAAGSISITDADQGQASFQTSVTGVAGNLGNLVLAANGSYTYTVADGAVQYLGASDSKVETFTVTSLDGTQKQVSFTIHGANDAAILSSDVRDLTEGNTAAAISTSGTLTISDVDSPATFVAQSATAGQYGSFSVNGSGAWSYSASSAHNEFVAGTTYTDTFSVSSADGTTTSVTINIVGTNDAAVITGTSTAALTESNAAQATGGTLAANDPDSAPTFIAQTNVAGDTGFGSFTIGVDGVWTYTMNGAHDEFVGGQTYTDSITVTTADGTAQVLTVNILGTNDAAVITGTSTASLTENNAAQITGGVLSATDVDGSAAFVAQTGIAGNHSLGAFSISAFGAWTYTMNGAHDELVAGQTYTDSATVTTADGTPQVITVNILGTDDAAVITGSSTASLTESDAPLSATGQLFVNDVDSAATFVAQINVAGSNGYGTFSIDSTGAWTYATNGAHNEFVDGQTYTDSVTVTTADGTQQVITVNILGTNDAAVIGGTTTESLIEADAPQSTGGKLVMSDVDNPNGFVAQTQAGSNDYGTFSIDSSGAWTYTMNCAHNEFVGGQTYTDSATVMTADGTPQLITVNILGTNDAAAITGASTAELTQSAIAQSTGGNLTATDVDSSAGFVAQTGVAGNHGYGMFSIDAAGAWTYTMNGPHTEFGGGTNYTDSATVTTADGTAQVLTVTMHGRNDAPTDVALDNAVVFSQTPGGTVGNLAVADPDATDTAFTFAVSDDRFEVVSSNGQALLKLKAGESVDIQHEQHVNLTVTVIDAGGLSAHHDFTLDVAVNGFVADGYIANALVFADTNHDGQLSSGEAHTMTDQFGNFTLVGGTGPIILMGMPGGMGTPGSIDISTGLPFTGTMSAPEGSTVVTPLTNLVAAIAGANADAAAVAAANAQVLSAFGIGGNVDLSSFDPIAATLSSDTSTAGTGQAAITAAIQLQNTIVQSASLLAGATSATDATAATAAVVSALAQQVVQASQSSTPALNLNDSGVISSVLTTAASDSSVGATVSADVLAGATSVITATNGVVIDAAANATSSGSVAVLSALAQVATIAQQSTAQALATAGSDGNTGAISGINASSIATDASNVTVDVGLLVGANGPQTLIGTDGADNLNGYGGDDILSGLGGNDTLTGGADADIFVYANGGGADVITDFSHSQGDKIDLTGVDNVFSFADVQALSSGTTSTVINFGNGNSLTLNNVAPGSLVASDFIFAPDLPPTDILLSSATVAENSGPGTIVGSLSAVDPNNGEPVTLSLLDNAGGAFAIQNGKLVVAGPVDFEQTPVLSVHVLATDRGGNTLDKTFNVAVSNVNEAPTVTAPVTATAAEGSGAATVSLLANASDPDAGATLHVANLTWTDGIGLPPGVSVSADGNSVMIDSNNAAYNSLAVGQTAVAHFSYDVVDEFGVSVHQSATLTVTGTNDAPTVSTAVTASATENSSTQTVNLLQHASDVDAGAVLHVANLVWTDTGTGLPPGITLSGTSLIVDTNNAAFNGLAEGQTQTAHFGYDVVDDQGALVHQTATLTVTGTNDQPTITIGAGDSTTGTVTDNSLATTLTAAGTLSFADVDLTDVHSVFASVVGTTLGSLVPVISHESTGSGSGGVVNWTYQVSEASVQSLTAGQTAADTFMITVSDGHGGTVQQAVTVTIVGTDPTLGIAGQTTGSVSEDTGIMATSGKLTTNTGTPAWSIVGGTTTASTQDFRFAADSLTITKSSILFFQDTFGDGNPPPSAPNLTGGPNVGYTAQGSFTEANGFVFFDGTRTATFGTAAYGERATLNTDTSPISDPVNGSKGLKANADFTVEAKYLLVLPEDGGDAYGVRLSDQASPGNNTGSVDLVVIRDAAGEHVELRQINGSTSQVTILQSIDLTNVGANDEIALHLNYDHTTYTNTTTGGSVTASFDLLTNGVVSSTQSFSAHGTIFQGEDFTQVLLLAQSNQSETGVYKQVGTYGTLTVAQDGQWHYLLADQQTNVQQLAAGHTATDTFTVQVSDGHGGTATQQIVETVTGTNDAPVVSAAITANGTEGSGTTTVNLLQNASDVDTGAVLHVANVVWTETGSGLPAGVTLNGNSLAVDTNNAAYDGLAAGQIATAHIGYDVVDDQGAVVHQTVTLSITGTNDAPVVSGAVAGTAAEDGATSTLNALANASDVDFGTTLSVVNVPGSLPAGVSFSTASHSFTLDPSAAAYQSLASGQTTTVTVSYGVSDGTATTPASVSWTVSGTNDAPVVSAAVTGTATEDGATSTLNALANASDVDAGTTLAVVNVPGSLPAGVSFDAASHSFTLDPSAAAYQSLASGQTTTVTVSYGVSDGTATTPASVSWTVSGTNDAPVVSAAVTGTATEDGATSTLNALANASDVDAGTTLAVVNVPGSLPAGVSFDAASHSFTLDPSAAAYQSLASGQTTTVTVSYGVSDGTATTPASVSWTVSGTNDAPVVSAAVTGTATEDGATSTLNALANASDVDAGTTLAVVNVPGSLPAGVSFDAASHSFTLDPSAAAYQSLASGQTTTVTVSYGVSDGTATTPASVSWTVSGTNDAPVVSAAVTNTATAGTGTQTENLLQNASDVDAGAVLHVANLVWTGGAGLPAGVTLSGDGNSLIVDTNNAAYASLTTAQSATAQFSYDVVDDQGAVAHQTATLTINGSVAGLGIAGQTTGSVSEDTGIMATSGKLTTNTGTPAWSIVGGTTTASTQDFRFAADSLTITKSSILFFQDTFGDGNPPPSAPNLTGGPNVGYTAQGSFTEANGFVFFDGTRTATFGTAAYGERATLNTDTSPISDPVNGSKGLKANADFTVEAKYLLVLPEDGGDAYGVRLSDQASPGNNTGSVDLVVIRDAAGEHVELRQINGSTSQVTILQSIDLTNVGANDEIALHLNYDHTTYTNTTTGGSVTASFDLLTNGVVSSTQSFSAHGTIFQGEDFTQVLLLAQSNQSETGVYKQVGTYGTLTVAQDGQWHYLLADQQTNVQQLAAGHTATDTFTVQVSDGHGGTATQQIVETVTGTNDAPVVSAAITANGTEGSGTTTVNLLQNASDVDTGAVLHVANVVWTETGSGLPAGVTLNGNSLAVDTNNAAYDGLAAGQIATAHIGYDVVDDQGAVVHQTVTLSITGTNDAPVVEANKTVVVGADVASTPLNITAPTDVDGDSLSITVTGLPAGSVGSVFLANSTPVANGQSLTVADLQGLTFAPNPNAGGSTGTFSYTVNDGHGGTASESLSLAVQNGSNAPIVIATGNTVELPTPYSGAAAFAGATGTLQLDAASGFTGQISGFSAQDAIDLRAIGFGANTTLGYSGDNNAGTLTASDGVHSANISLLGQYVAQSFAKASDGHGGTVITDPPVQDPNQLAQPHA